ncbi:MAG: hypothetical protein H0T62_11335 [Parachlamydiaceae bacterium]|nr:hypothetical protein [Parachlamydiaceae bacterium]
MQINSYHPSYIIDQAPQRFGGRQSDYIHQANGIINLTADKIIQAREGKSTNLQKFFFEIIAELSSHRGRIAFEHQTEDFEKFGKRRDNDNNYPGRTSTLLLFDVYKEYGDKLINLFSRYLEKMESNGKFENNFLIDDVCDGRITSLNIEVMDNTYLHEQNYNREESYIPDFEEETRNKKDKDWSEDKILEYRTKYLKFKLESPEKYQKRRITQGLARLQSECPSPEYFGLKPNMVRQIVPKKEADIILGNMKSLYVHVVLETEIDREMHILTEYFTWMFEDSEWIHNKTDSHHPIKRMKESSEVLLVHQDEFLIEKTLNEIAKIFEKVVTWNSMTYTEFNLKDSMAHLCFLSAHNMRDFRGSAAETEWLEHSIYRSHGFKIAVKEKRIIDLDAFANPIFSNFKEKYHQVTTLIPL